MATVTQIGPRLGIAATCAALGLPRATYYRRRRPSRAAPPRRRSPRALSAGERGAVLALLHEPRFVDHAPAEVYATLLDAGQYVCSERTMYRLLAEHAEVRERRDQLRHPVYAAPELLARRPNELWSWGCGAGTSPSCSARRSGPTSTCTSCSTCSAATWSARWCRRVRTPRSPSSSSARRAPGTASAAINSRFTPTAARPWSRSPWPSCWLISV